MRSQALKRDRGEMLTLKMNEKLGFTGEERQTEMPWRGTEALLCPLVAGKLGSQIYLAKLRRETDDTTAANLKPNHTCMQIQNLLYTAQTLH